MPLFTFLARRSFRTAPDGRRTFRTGGRLSRAYVVPDAATEERLLADQARMLLIYIGLVVGVTVGLGVVGIALQAPLARGMLPLVGIGSYFVARSLAFGNDLRGLERIGPGADWTWNPRIMAGRLPVATLVIVALLPLPFVALGVMILEQPQAPQAFGWFCIILPGLMTAGYAYLLFLRLSGRSIRPVPAA